ncbi:MAG: aspartyl protease family protein [Candidatus Freyarchaeota archaeon]
MKYDLSKEPPIPKIELTIANPGTKESVKCVGPLDTGADFTVLPRKLVSDLGLKPAREIEVIDIYGRMSYEWTYYVNIYFNTFSFEFVEVLAIPQDEVIIGRDILNNVKLILNGKKLRFEIFDP